VSTLYGREGGGGGAPSQFPQNTPPRRAPRMPADRDAADPCRRRATETRFERMKRW
jgi:hypothetical protein